MFEKRQRADYRTMGDIFFAVMEQYDAMNIDKAVSIICDAVFDTLENSLHLTDKQLDTFMMEFYAKLPKSIKESLSRASNSPGKPSAA